MSLSYRRTGTRDARVRMSIEHDSRLARYEARRLRAAGDNQVESVKRLSGHLADGAQNGFGSLNGTREELVAILNGF